MFAYVYYFRCQFVPTLFIESASNIFQPTVWEEFFLGELCLTNVQLLSFKNRCKFNRVNSRKTTTELYSDTVLGFKVCD
jgi:hypothetical protein